MYELHILGELMLRPLHGYMLHTILNRVMGQMRTISWGVLYPLIRKLEEDSFIEQVHSNGDTVGRGRRKKTYQITEAGRERFHYLMEEPIEYSADYELHFHIKMGKFGLINDDLKLHIFHQYKNFLRINSRHIRESRIHILESGKVPEEEVPYIVDVQDHILMQIEFNESWLDKQIEKLKTK